MRLFSKSLLICCMLAQAVWAQDAPLPEDLPTFDHGEHKLLVTAMDVASHTDLVDETKTKHLLAFDGLIQPNVNEDIVAVSKELKATRVYDANGAEMLPMPSRSRVMKIQPLEEFTAVIDGKAITEMPKTQLSTMPWLMQSMDAESTLIVAKARHEQRLAAAVMEEFTNVAGVDLRVDRLSMSNDRKLTVSLQYQRGGSGPAGPFVEAVYALDAEGKPLGGGRWVEGSPMKERGKLAFVFPLQDVQYHHGFRIVVCTEYEAKPIGFTLTGLFAQ